MSKKSLQKKVAMLNEYITKEIEKEMMTEIWNKPRFDIIIDNSSNFANTRAQLGSASTVLTPAPYDAFDQSISVGLNISQGESGNFENDLPFVKPNFEVGGP